MFRKPKRKVQNLRRKDEEDDPKDDDDEEEQTTGELLHEAKKRAKPPRAVEAASTKQSSTSVMHSYDTSKGQQLSNADLATRTAEHHAVAAEKNDEDKEEQAKQEDGIFRNKQQNKFLAGPIRAAQHVRVTARFDYQPDICKDYKDTGFCGFGDTCIYLHDRGDTMTGWQLEQQWEKEQREKKEKQEKEMTDFLSTHSGSKNAGGVSIPDDGLPFACHFCRTHFTDPVVTACNHYFCEKCIMDHVRRVSEACPICNADTSSVFNQPTKLIAKKRRVVGAKASWEDYYKAVTGKTIIEE